MTDYYVWAHFNDVSVKRLGDLLPEATIITEGDCGSVWGEHHPEGISCPFPHVLIHRPTLEDVKVLKDAGLRFILDLTGDWGERIEDWRWLEDRDCLTRSSFEKDFRKPFTPYEFVTV